MSQRPAIFGCKKIPNSTHWPVWWWVRFPDGTSMASAANTRAEARGSALAEAQARGLELTDESGGGR